MNNTMTHDEAAVLETLNLDALEDVTGGAPKQSFSVKIRTTSGGEVEGELTYTISW